LKSGDGRAQCTKGEIEQAGIIRNWRSWWIRKSTNRN